MDAIEQKNDQIHDEFKKLLQSSREARNELKRQQEEEQKSSQPTPTEEEKSKWKCFVGFYKPDLKTLAGIYAIL